MTTNLGQELTAQNVSPEQRRRYQRNASWWSNNYPHEYSADLRRYFFSPSSRRYYIYATRKRLIKCQKVQARLRQVTWRDMYKLGHYLGNVNNITALFGTAQECHFKPPSVNLSQNWARPPQCAHRLIKAPTSISRVRACRASCAIRLSPPAGSSWKSCASELVV